MTDTYPRAKKIERGAADPYARTKYKIRRGVATCWVLHDGTVISIKDMTDAHLLNTITFLEHRAKAIVAELIRNPPQFQGEIAQYLADQQYDALVRGDFELEDVLSDLNAAQLAGLRKDACRRGLL